tara:strand:- start:386 stop:1297 length:912 start_codon:yes stop_codon:yes gene_type:complete
MSTTSKQNNGKLEKMTLLELEIFAENIGINIDEINRHFPHIDKYISSLKILNKITKPQLKKHAEKLNIELRDATVATLRKNFIKEIYNAVIEKRKKHGAKVLYENLPNDIQREIEKKVELSANPEIEEKIEQILRGMNTYRLMNYDYYKIRSSLGIKHYTTKKEIEIKVGEFEDKYIIDGVIHYYLIIEDILGIIIQDVSPEEIPNVDFQSRNDSFNRMFINLKEYIEKYNQLAKELKTKFLSSIKPEFIGEINDTIKIFNKKFKKHLPYLKYGTREFLSHQSNSSRKNRYSSRRLTRRANTM